MKKNEHIKCKVESCAYNNCDCGCCSLDEIEVSCDCPKDEANDKQETICSSFCCKEEK